MKKGYKPDFIGDGIDIPLPTFSPKLGRSVLRKPGILRDEKYADHIHFTLVMNKNTRSLIYSAYNIDQSLLKKSVPGKGKRPWRKDQKIGAEFQLGNEYYADRTGGNGEKIPNPYDKGHMAMRANTMWGKTKKDADAAGKATFNYANAALQHMNLNRDEWKELELKIVRSFTHDSNDRLSVFTGPIYGDLDRYINLSDTDNARVPAGFFKVLCYRTKYDDPAEQLGVLAFAIFQDAEILRDLRGATIKTERRYQVTIRQLQAMTGIRFSKQLVERNPLVFEGDEVRNAKLKIPKVPELIPIEGTQNLIANHQDPRCDIRELAAREVVINSAMIDPKGNEKTGEWISLLNRTARKKSLKNWKLIDGKGRQTLLSADINSGQSIRLKGKDMGTLKLGNSGGSLMLYNQKGCIIDHVTWSKSNIRSAPEGLAFLFAAKR